MRGDAGTSGGFSLGQTDGPEKEQRELNLRTSGGGQGVLRVKLGWNYGEMEGTTSRPGEMGRWNL